MWWKKVTANKEFGTLKNILKSEGKIKMISGINSHENSS